MLSFSGRNFFEWKIIKILLSVEDDDDDDVDVDVNKIKVWQLQLLPSLDHLKCHSSIDECLFKPLLALQSQPFIVYYFRNSVV